MTPDGIAASLRYSQWQWVENALAASHMELA
jgi:hypothetical protein